MPPRLRTLLVIATTCAVTAGCSVQRALDIERLKASIITELEAQTGIRPTRVACPDEVFEKKGETFECLAFADDGSSARVVVEMLSDGKVDFTVRTP